MCDASSWRIADGRTKSRGKLMLLTKVEIEDFKSIDQSGEVTIDPDVTVLVGQNESGKTAFLQAIDKARSVHQGVQYNVTDDYPRNKLMAYQPQHPTKPATVAHLTYQLTGEVERINQGLGLELVESVSFTTHHDYKNQSSISLNIPEEKYVSHLLSGSGLPAETVRMLGEHGSARGVIEAMGKMDLTAEGKAFLQALQQRFQPPSCTNWQSLTEALIWRLYIEPSIPRFFYFDDYYLLPGKVNLAELQRRVAAPQQMHDEDHTVVSLLRMAGVQIAELSDQRGYENVKARLEGLSNSITDKIFRYWRQNQELDVEFDIRPDPTDSPPFNSGPNLYIRIRSRRHRVSVPFSQRSKGFIWFFSFIVWFDTVRQQQKDGSPLILLLDEPGLSLHALAQADFLRYIDDLAENHQILYTTHSPFMIHSDRLHQVRLVEDRKDRGSVITDNITGSDAKTIFPLQAALGYTIAQNLFISKRNLLVEGPADLVYLRFFSDVLESQGRKGLRADITLVPAGGLDKVATFIALLGANELEIGVVHDTTGKPDQHLDSLIRQKLIRERQVLNYGMFRTPVVKGKGPAGTPPPVPVATDVEDLIKPVSYLTLFNAAFEKGLCGAAVNESDLPPGDRIVDRVNRYLTAKGIVPSTFRRVQPLRSCELSGIEATP